MNIMLNFNVRRLDDKYERLKQHLFDSLACSEAQKKSIVHILSMFKHQFTIRWNKSKRQKRRMMQNNAEWLKKSVAFPRAVPTPSATGRGRPELSFQQSSERSKRRKTASLRSEVPVDELTYAAHMSLRSSGKPAAASVLKDITTTSPARASRYKEAFKRSKESKESKLTPEQALSVFVEAKLTRQQYNVIRAPVKDRYPSYKIIQQAKKKCYPDNITVSEESAKVPLQELLDHTTKRILLQQKDVLLSLDSAMYKNLTLISKWGCDGSAGHSEYKQKFKKHDSSDAYMFLTSLVPLQLSSSPPDSPNTVIIWKNPRPSSPRFCRPIHLQQVHETTEITVAEMNNVEKEISLLKNTTYQFNDQLIRVTHELLFTMTDGKVCNAVTETTSTMKCYLCEATSKDFNNIGKMILRPIDQSRFRFGLSTLHAWIRFFECLLHVAYKLPIKKWQVRGEAEKKIVAENKKLIQEKFKETMGLIVDKPKPGYGNTNDGNTARRFFKNPTLSAEVTGIQEELISKFKIILETISCGYEINTVQFKKYCLETAELYVSIYPWYKMPTTVHKILIHGPEVISHALLPIGQLSEEAQEARNKDIKKYREAYSRKISREKTLEDVFNLLLISSDPLISSARELPKKKFSVLEKETIQLLETPKVFPRKIFESSDEDNLDSDSD